REFRRTADRLPAVRLPEVHPQLDRGRRGHRVRRHRRLALDPLLPSLAKAWQALRLWVVFEPHPRQAQAETRHWRCGRLGGYVSAELLSWSKRFMVYSIQMLKRREPEWFRQDLTTLLGLLERGELKPLIHRRLPLEQAALAQELLAKSETI